MSHARVDIVVNTGLYCGSFSLTFATGVKVGLLEVVLDVFEASGVGHLLSHRVLHRRVLPQVVVGQVPLNRAFLFVQPSEVTNDRLAGLVRVDTVRLL